MLYIVQYVLKNMFLILGKLTSQKNQTISAVKITVEKLEQAVMLAGLADGSL